MWIDLTNIVSSEKLKYGTRSTATMQYIERDSIHRSRLKLTVSGAKLYLGMTSC